MTPKIISNLFLFAINQLSEFKYEKKSKFVNFQLVFNLMVYKTYMKSNRGGIAIYVWIRGENTVEWEID